MGDHGPAIDRYSSNKLGDRATCEEASTLRPQRRHGRTIGEILSQIHHQYPQKHITSFQVQAAADWFLCEALSIAVAALSLGGITAVLISFNGKARPQWPIGITINSILSWLSTIARSALLVPITKGISQLKWAWFSSVQGNEEEKPLG